MDMQPHERIYVAVDTNDITKALPLAGALKGKVGGFKIGLEFFTAIFVLLARLNLKQAIGLLIDMRELFELIGDDLFWDGKFDDIPNTVGGASLGLKPLSPKFFNVHASSGFGSVVAAVANRGKSKVLAVTLLTSFDERSCMNYFNAQPELVIPVWARHAVKAGADGLICSPADVEWVNKEEKLRSVPKMAPGVRPLYHIDPKEDQSRVMTPAKALKAGVTWMVIGRPITQYSEGPAKAVERIVDELAE